MKRVLRLCYLLRKPQAITNQPFCFIISQSSHLQKERNKPIFQNTLKMSNLQ